MLADYPELEVGQTGEVYPDSYFTTRKMGGTNKVGTVLTDINRLSAYNEAAMQVWPNLVLKKEHMEAIEQVCVAGPSGVPPSEVKRGSGDAFFALSTMSKDPSSAQVELSFTMAGKLEGRDEVQEDNLLIRMVLDEKTTKSLITSPNLEDRWWMQQD